MCAHHQHCPLLSCLSVQFLLDGKVLSLTDFQVGVMGVQGLGQQGLVWEDGGKDASFWGKGLPGGLAGRSLLSVNLGRAEMLL